VAGSQTRQAGLPEIAGPDDPESLLEDDGRNAMALVLLGVPRADVWRTIVCWRAASGFAPPIDLIEPDEALLKTWRQTLAGAEVDADSGARCRCHAGAEALERYEKSLLMDPARMLPTRIITSGRAEATLPPREAVSRLIDRVQAARRDAAARHIERQRRIYEPTSAATWGRRFRRAGVVEPALRIVGITTRHSTVMRHAMRDLAGAFRRAGCVFELVMEEHEHTSTIEAARVIAEREPDLVVVINHLKSELHGEVHAGVPYACWIQDHMPALWHPQAGRSIGDVDLVLGQSRSLMARQFAYPADRFLETSNVTDPSTYGDEPLDEAELAPWRCDISFVSHGSAPAEAMLADMARGEPPAVERCLRHVLALMREALERAPYIRSLDLAAMLLEAERAAGLTGVTPAARLNVLLQRALALYDRLLRHQTLQWAATWADSRRRTLRLHGRGWEHHPALARHAAGEIANGRALRALHQASAVNLQVNGYGSMHQRLLDALASGGFALVRFHPADVLRRHYETLRDVICRDALDLAGIARRRGEDAALDSKLSAIEALEGVRIAPMNDLLRRRQRDVQALVFNLPSRQNDDAALLRRLCALDNFPRRIAGDLPGYADVTFRTETTMHELLDQFVLHADGAEARARASAPMRASVLEHDTSDALVRRILAHYRGLGLGGESFVGSRLDAARGLDPGNVVRMDADSHG